MTTLTDVPADILRVIVQLAVQSARRHDNGADFCNKRYYEVAQWKVCCCTCTHAHPIHADNRIVSMHDYTQHTNTRLLSHTCRVYARSFA